MWNGDKKVLSVDIGCQTVKALVLTGQGKDRVVLNAGNVELARTNEQGWETHPREDIEGALTYLFKKMGVKVQAFKHIISSLSGNSYSLKQIQTLELTGDELDSSLLFEARKHLPARGDIIMDYQVMKKAAGKLDVLLAVAQKAEVKDHIDVLRSVGAREGEVDLPPLGLLNLFVYKSGLNGEMIEDGKTRLLINMGSRFTQLCFINEKHPLFIRELTLGGQDFTRELALKNDLSVADAEKEKIKNGIFNPSKDAQVGQSGLSLTLESHTRSVLDRLGDELKRTIRFYGKDTGVRDVEEYWVTGGCVRDVFLVEELKNRLRGEVIPLDPFAEIKTSDERDDDNPYQYGVCLGMALRKIDGLLQN